MNEKCLEHACISAANTEGPIYVGDERGFKVTSEKTDRPRMTARVLDSHLDVYGGT